MAQVLLSASSASAYDDFFPNAFGDDFYGLRSDSVTFGHGNAVAHNIAVQTIDPWPRYVGKSRIDVDGERHLVGISRYKANKSIPPRGLATQDIFVDRNSGAKNNN